MSEHQSTMTQHQRMELVRILSAPVPVPGMTITELASLTDRQLHLTWEHVCGYITNEEFAREYAACVGEPLFKL